MYRHATVNANDVLLRNMRGTVCERGPWLPVLGVRGGTYALGLFYLFLDWFGVIVVARRRAYA